MPWSQAEEGTNTLMPLKQSAGMSPEVLKGLMQALRRTKAEKIRKTPRELPGKIPRKTPRKIPGRFDVTHKGCYGLYTNESKLSFTWSLRQEKKFSLSPQVQ